MSNTYRDLSELEQLNQSPTNANQAGAQAKALAEAEAITLDRKKRQAAEEATKMRQAAAQGAWVQPNANTGKAELARHDDGAVKFTPAAVGEVRPVSQTKSDPSKVNANIMLGADDEEARNFDTNNPTQTGTGEATGAAMGGETRTQYGQVMRDDRGNHIVNPEKPLKDIKTGLSYVERVDPATGIKARVLADVDMAQQAKIGRAMLLDDEQASLDMRNNAIGQQKLSLSPEWDPVKKEYEEAKTELEKLPNDLQKRGEIWVKVNPETGVESAVLPFEVARRTEVRKQAEQRMKNVEGKYNELSPRVASLDTAARDTAMRKLKIDELKIRMENDIPDDDAGVASVIALTTGKIAKLPVQAAMENVIGDPMAPSIDPITGAETAAPEEVTQPLIKPDTDPQAAKQAFAPFNDMEGIEVRSTKQQSSLGEYTFHSLYKDGKLVGTTSYGGVGPNSDPIIILNKNAGTKGLINLEETTGAPVYLDRNDNRKSLADEADEVAAIFAEAKNPENKGKLGERMKALRATPADIMQRVESGELSMQHGQVILKEIYGTSMASTDPTDPKEFAKWVAETTRSENKAVQERTGDPSRRKEGNTGQRLSEAKSGLRDFSAEDDIKKDFLVDKYLENQGKPMVMRSDYVKLHEQINSKRGASATDIAGSWLGFAGKTLKNDVAGSIFGLAAGAVGQGGAGIVALTGDEKAKKDFNEFMYLRNRSMANFTTGFERNVVKWTTGMGKEASKQHETTLFNLKNVLDQELDKPYAQRDQARIDEAKQKVIGTSMELHGLARDENWKVTEADFDPDKDVDLGVALARYEKTGDPRMFEQFKARLLMNKGSRELARELDKKVTNDGFWGAVEGGMYAGWQELGTELLADASMVITAGGSKAVQAGLRSMGAVGKAKQLERLGQAVARGLARVETLGIKAESLINPLTKLDKVVNTGVAVGKTGVQAFAGEAGEEVIVEMGADNPDVIHAALVGGLGGIAMTPAFYPMQRAIQRGQAKDAIQIIDKENAKFAQNYNKEMADIEGFEPITKETASMAREFLDVSGYAAKTKDLAATIEQIASMEVTTPEQQAAHAELIKGVNKSMGGIAMDSERSIEAAREIASMEDPEQRSFYSGIAKVASGNVDTLTQAERAAIQQAQTDAGNSYFANVGGREVLTDEARAEIAINAPMVGEIIQTTESKAILEAQAQQSTQNEPNTQGQPGAQAPTQATPATQAAQQPAQPMGNPAAGGAGGGAAPQAAAPAVTQMDAAEYAAAQASDASLPSIEQAVSAAYSQGAPVSASMAKAAGIEIPDGYQQQGAEWVNPQAQAATGTPAQQVAARVKAAVEAALPAIKGRLNIVEEGMIDADGNVSMTGGAYADANGISISIPDIEREMRGRDPAEFEATLYDTVVKHEVVHVIQYEALRQLLAKQSGGKSFETFFREFYGKMAAEFSPEVFAAAREIYGENSWDAIPDDSLKAAEVVRMLVEARLNPDRAAEFSELARAINMKVPAQLIDLLKQAVDILVAMVKSGALPEQARQHIEQVAAMYEEMLTESPAPAEAPNGSLPDGQSPTSRDVGESAQPRIEVEGDKAKILKGNAVLWNGAADQADAKLAEFVMAENSTQRLAGLALVEAGAKFGNLTDEQKAEIDSIDADLAELIERLPQEQRYQALVDAYTQWIDEAKEAVEEAAPKTQKQRATESAAQRKAEAIINSGNFPAINAIIASGSRLQPRANIIGLILKRKKNGQKLKEAELKSLRDDQEYNGYPTQSGFGRSGDGKVAREVLKKLIGQQKEGMRPDEIAGYLILPNNPKPTASDFFDQLDKELRAISNGTALEGDKADPNRERTDAEIAEELAEMEKAKQGQEAAPRTLEDIHGEAYDEFGDTADITERAWMLQRYANRFNPEMTEVVTDFLEADMERIRQGVIDPVKWLETATGWPERIKKYYLPLARMSNTQLEAWAKALPLIEEEDPTALFSSPSTPWPTNFPEVVIQTTISKMKSHADYDAAKSGDDTAAIRLVRDMIKPGKVLDLAKQFPKAIVAAVHAEEATGRNQIPLAYAQNIGQIGKLEVDEQIVQANRVFHTGSDAAHRLFEVPVFLGPVMQGRQYIIVDDVTTSGSSLSALRNYIVENGGTVVAASTLATTSNPQTGYGGYLAIKPETLQKLREKFDVGQLEEVLQTYAIAESPDSLTNSQGKYLLGFKSVDSIRDRLAAKEQAGIKSEDAGTTPEVKRAGRQVILEDNGQQRLFSSPSQGSMDFGASGEMGDRTQRGLSLDSLPETGDKAKFQTNAQKALDNAPSDKAREAIATDVAKREGISKPATFIKAAMGGQAAFDFGTSGSLGTRQQPGFDFSEKAPSVAAETTKDTKPEWQNFTAADNTLGIPRAEMPQVKAENRGAMVNFLKARGITSEAATVDANTLLPTQAEYSPAKVKKALAYEGGNRSILVGSQNRILDGHHQWMAAMEKGEPIDIIRLSAPILELIELVKDMPSTETAADTAPAVRTEATAPAAPRPAQSTDTITDFGEKIGGARKDYAQTFAEAKELDIIEEPFSKVWPEPNYKKLAEEGADPWAIGFIRAMRDTIPTKPRQTWKVERYARQVETLRTLAEMLMGQAYIQNKAKELLGTAQYLTVNEEVGGTADLYELVGHDQSLKGIRFGQIRYSIYKGEQNVTKWEVTKKAKATLFGNMPRTIAEGNTREEALEAFKAVMQSGDMKSKSKPTIKFDIYRYTGLKSVKGSIIGKKVGRHHVDLFTFESAKEAREYLNENYDDVLSRFESYQKIASERRSENAPRIGDDHLQGGDVTPEQFQKAFGFRGVEFGNYVEQARRQKDLNRAYEGLMDLAGILNVPSRAISLNGELSLAFGARGKGGKNAPAAHYEAGKIVINLTKISGPGSLGHEWFHAMDNYFLRQVGKIGGFATEQKRTWGGRPEVMESFSNVVKAIDASGMRKRSQLLDKKRSSPYWSTDVELSARAFENYLIERLKGKEATNDYLANITSHSDWLDSMMDSFVEGTETDSYPYLTAEETGPIGEAFDKLFSTIQTEQTEKGVRLFSSPSQVRSYLDNNGTPSEVIKSESERVSRALAQPSPSRLAEGGAAYSQDDLFGIPATDIGQEIADAAASTSNSAKANPTGNAVSDDLVKGLTGNWEALAREVNNKGRASTILADLINREIPVWNVNGTIIETPADVHALMIPLRSPYFESMKVMVVDGNQKIVHSQIMTVGTLNETTAHSGEIMGALARLREVHGKKYTSLIISHNHPSGDPNPSNADFKVTENLREVAEMTGWNVLDHIITNGEKYYRFRDTGTLWGGSAEKPYTPRKQDGTRVMLSTEDTRKAPWEAVLPSKLQSMDTPKPISDAARHLRQGNPTAAHIFYLNTRLQMLAVERVDGLDLLDKRKIAKTLIAARGREGAYAFAVDYPSQFSGVEESKLIEAMTEVSMRIGVRMIDAIKQTPNSYASMREAGRIQEDAAEYGKTQGQPDLFAAVTAPDAAQKLGAVKAGSMNALGAFRTLTAKRAKLGSLSAKEEQQLLDAETALGQKMAFDMEEVKGDEQSRNPLQLPVQGMKPKRAQAEIDTSANLFGDDKSFKATQQGQMTLFSSPALGSLRDTLNKSFSKPPSELIYENDSNPSPEVQEVLTIMGATSRTPSNALEIRKIESQTGTTITFVGNVGQGIQGFTYPRHPSLIFINSEETIVPLSSLIAHELLHVAQKDSRYDTAGVRKAILDRMTEGEIVTVANALLEEGYTPSQLSTEIPAFFMGDAVSGHNSIGLPHWKKGAEIKASLLEFFDTIEDLKPDAMPGQLENAKGLSLFSSPSPGSFRQDLIFSFSKPPSEYTYEPSDERRATVLEIAEANGITLLYSPDLDSATRSLLKRTGAETIFYRGGDIKTAGFVSERDARLIFVNSERGDIPAAWVIAHELTHVAQKDKASGADVIRRKIAELLTPGEFKSIEDTLRAAKYPEAELATELPAFLVGDAIADGGRIGWKNFERGEELIQEIKSWFDSLPMLKPEILEDVADDDLLRLNSSPTPEPTNAAIEQALAKMPPTYRKVFAAINGGASPIQVATEFDISDRAVTNILNQVRARLEAVTAAEKNTLKVETNEEGKIKGGGRPDLALGGNRQVAAVDQIRNQSGVQDVRGWAEVNAQAQKMLTDDYAGTYDAMLEKARNLQPMTDVEVSVTKRIIARETMEGRITTPEERVKMAMLIHGYRDIGTETARALAMRRDTEMKPAERHAQFIAEALFSPDSKTRARLRKSSPQTQEAILAGWMMRVDKIKAELKARGYDLDASLAAYQGRKTEMEEAAAMSPRTAAIIEENIRKLSKREKIIVDALRSGQTTYEGAAYLTGMTKEEAKQVYSTWVNGIKASMQESAKRYLETTLGSSAGTLLDSILEELGVIDPDLIPMDEADRTRVESEKAAKGKKAAKPRKKKAKAESEPEQGNDAVLPEETTETPEPLPINETTGTFDLNNPMAMTELIQAFSIARSTTGDKIMEYWRMSILSGPHTHIVNAGSNVMHAAYRMLPRRLVEAGANSALSLVGLGSKESATFGEFSAMAKNLRTAAGLAGRLALRVWKTEERMFEQYATQAAEQVEFTGAGAEQFAPAVGGPFGKIMRSLSFRAMTTADEFIKAFTGQLEAAAQAHRIAKVEEKLSGTAYEKRINELMEPGSIAWVRALDETKTITFQTNLDGNNPQTLARIDQVAIIAKNARNLPWLGKPLTFFIPFIDTPTNIFKESIKMTPIALALAVIDGTRALNRKFNRGGLTKEEANLEAGKLYNRARLVDDVTNQTIGIALYFAISSLLEGDEDDDRPFITGTQPYKTTRRGERDNSYAVMPEQSIRIGNTTLSYRRWEPFATVLASLVDLARETNSNNGELDAGVVSAWIGGHKNQLKDKTFLQGIGSLMDAFEDPDRFLTRLTTNITTGFIPNAIRQPIRTADPMQRDTTPRGDQGFFESVARGMGHSIVPSAAPIKFDVWGNPVTKNRGQLIGGSQVTDSALRILDPTNITVNPDIDPIDRWIFRYNNMTAESKDRIAILPISDKISVTLPGAKRQTRISLTAQEQEEANRRAGQAARAMLGNEWEKTPHTEQNAQRIIDTVLQVQAAERARLKIVKLAEGVTEK